MDKATKERKDALEVAANIAEHFYLTYPSEHEILRANVRSIGDKIASAIRQVGVHNQQLRDTSTEPQK